MKRFMGIIGLATLAVLLMGGVSGVQGDGKHPAVAKVYRPEKEEVARGIVGPGSMRDSCVPLSLFELSTRRPTVC